jgi:hypothetical protein
LHLLWNLPDNHSGLTIRGKSESIADSGTLLAQALPISSKMPANSWLTLQL